MFTALLDSCVLWPSTQRNFLLSLAIEGAYRFILSEAILDELVINEELKLIRRGEHEQVARTKSRHLIAQMRGAFADSIVHGWEGLDGTYNLPDPDDEHVLAAAVVGGAGSIVTNNLKDFPMVKIPPGIQIVTPQDFAFETVGIRPDLGAAAVLAMAQRTGHSYEAHSPEEILSTLDKLYQMQSTTELIRHLL